MDLSEEELKKHIVQLVIKSRRKSTPRILPPEDYDVIPDDPEEEEPELAPKVGGLMETDPILAGIYDDGGFS